jgi:ankyrin repeat protein
MKWRLGFVFLAVILCFWLVPSAEAGDREDNLVNLAGKGDVNGVRSLLDQGVNVNAKDSALGCTALVYAAQWDKPDVVRLLLARGADINMIGNGYTPLTMAAFLGRTDIVRILIDKGADVNKADESGKIAAGDEMIVSGRTALTTATDALEKGMPAGMDSSGNVTYNPLTPTEKEAYTAIVQMLKAAGAK